MQITNIKTNWGTTVEFTDPLDFFKQDKNVWRDMLYDRKLIIFKRMSFTPADYAKLGFYFGQPWDAEHYAYSHERVSTVADAMGKEYVVTQFSNLLIPQKTIGAKEMPWHADIPNRQWKPFPHRALWIVMNPSPEVSGKTKWLNIEEGIEYLTPVLAELVPRITIKQQSWYKEGGDEQMHSFVKVHPVTGKKSLRLNFYNDPSKNISKAWIKEVYVDGILQSDCSLIQQYIDHLLTVPELLHYHQWDDYDIAIYDNYTFVHGRTSLFALNVAGERRERKFYRVNIDHMSDSEWDNQNI